MLQKLTRLKETPSQTAGPYVHIGTNPNWVEITGVWNEDLGLVLVGPETQGRAHHHQGRMSIDGAGDPLKDALIEIWQADADGLYNSPQERRGRADPNFVGWGRQPADGSTGEYRFETIKPGRVPLQGRPPDGAAHHALDRGARHQYRPPHADVFRRRGGGQRGVPGSRAGSPTRRACRP